MIRYAVFGVGGFGRGVMPLVRQQLAHFQPESYELIFVDDNSHASLCNGSRVMTYENWIGLPASRRAVTLAIADSQAREMLADRCRKDGVEFFEVRAGDTVQLDEVSIGEGAILCPFVTLTSNIKIGKHFHANLYSYVEHDCVIGDFVTFAPGVKCNGNIVIEDHAYIGAGAIIKQGSSGMPLVIGRGAVIGMGAVVTRSVPAGATVIGNPARALVRT